MRALIQRVNRCSVKIDGEVVNSIENGMLILLGVKSGDLENDAEYLAKRCASLRIFDDENGKMNLSVIDITGSILVVSQFTLYGDTRRGNRPSYSDAAMPHLAESLYEEFVSQLKKLVGDDKVKMGVFRAMMDIELINNGPVTIIIDSKN